MDDNELISRAHQLRAVEPQLYEGLVPLAIAIAETIGDNNTLVLDSSFDPPGSSDPRRTTVWFNERQFVGVATSFHGSAPDPHYIRHKAYILEKNVFREPYDWRPTFKNPEAWPAFQRDLPRLRTWLARTLDYRTQQGIDAQVMSELQWTMHGMDPVTARAVIRSANAIKANTRSPEADAALDVRLNEIVAGIKLTKPAIEAPGISLDGP